MRTPEENADEIVNRLNLFDAEIAKAMTPDALRQIILDVLTLPAQDAALLERLKQRYTRAEPMSEVFPEGHAEHDSYKVYLTVGCQSFLVTREFAEDSEHADWFRNMLAKALARMVETETAPFASVIGCLLEHIATGETGAGAVIITHEDCTPETPCQLCLDIKSARGMLGDGPGPTDDELDLHAQRCTKTAMLGCRLCMQWADREMAKLRSKG